jgi:hypothetical protein
VTSLKPRLWGAARWVIWAAVAFVLLRGFISLLPDPKPDGHPAPAATETEPATDLRVRSFAALFAREYLSFSPGESVERAARLAVFLAQDVERTGGVDSSQVERAQAVTQVWPWTVTPQGTGHWAVTLVAQVQDAAVGKETPPPRYLALSVPVSAWKGGFAVSAYPAFIPVPLEKPGLEASQRDPGEVVSDPDPQVRDLLLGFLKAYAVGTPAEIRYYLLPGVELPGLNGQFAFRDLHGFELRKEGERYWAIADALVRDPVTGVDYHQHLLLELAKGERWYVKEILQKGGTVQ